MKTKLIKKIAVIMSAMTLLSTSAAVLAADSTANVSVESERVRLDRLNGDVNGSLFRTDLTVNNAVLDKTNPNEIVVTPKDYPASVLLNYDREEVETALNGYKSYSVKFDFKSNSTYNDADGTSKTFSDNTYQQYFLFAAKSKRIAFLQAHKNKMILFVDGTRTTYTYTINPDTWYNAEVVVTPPTGEQTAKDAKIKWYINGVMVSEQNYNTSSDYATDDFIPWALQMAYCPDSAKFGLTSIKNVEFYGINREEVNADYTVTKTDLADSINKDNAAAKTDSAVNFMRMNRSGVNYSVEEGGIKAIRGAFLLLNNISGSNTSLLSEIFSETSTSPRKGSYDSYSISFDIKPIETTETDPNKTLARIPLMSAYDENNGGDQYLAALDVKQRSVIVYTGLIKNAAYIGFYNRPSINVECVVKPSTKNIAWYADGALVYSGTLPVGKHNSTTAILDHLRCTDNTIGEDVNNRNTPIIDNIKLSLITNAHKSYGLSAEVKKVGNNLNLTFNKPISNARSVSRITVKDLNDTVISGISNTVADNKMSATLKLPNTATDPAYKITFPERFISEDGYGIITSSLVNSYLGLTRAEIVRNDDNTTLNIAFNNTMSEEKTVIVMLAAFDSNGTLKNISSKEYTINANSELAPSGEMLPVLNNESGVTYKGFVWNKETNVPLCEVVK